MAEQSTFENELPKKSTVEYVRGLDANGNPILINKSDLASVVGGLLPVADASKNGLMSNDFYRANNFYYTSSESGKFTHLFNLKQFAQGCFYLKFGDTADSSKISIGFIDLNNRSQGVISTALSKIAITEKIPMNLYAKRKEDNSIDVFVKQEATTYPVIRFCWIHSPEYWNWTYVGTSSEVSESELTKIL